MFCFMGLRYVTTIICWFLVFWVSLLCLHSDMSARCSTKRCYLIFLLYIRLCKKFMHQTFKKEREREREELKHWACLRVVPLSAKCLCWRLYFSEQYYMRINLFLRSTFFPIIDYFLFFLIYRYCYQEVYLKHFLLLTVIINYRFFLNEASIVRLFANISNHYHEISLCLLLVSTLAVTNYFIIVVQETLNPKSSVSLSKP